MTPFVGCQAFPLAFPDQQIRMRFGGIDVSERAVKRWDAILPIEDRSIVKSSVECQLVRCRDSITYLRKEWLERSPLRHLRVQNPIHGHARDHDEQQQRSKGPAPLLPP